MSKTIYGKDFAPIWDEAWAFWGEQMWPFVERVVRTKAPGARDWLDLCCGAGSLIKFIHKAGYRATGVDISPHQLARARRNAPGATLIQSDIRNFVRDAARAVVRPAPARRYDVITCMFDSLNYLADKRDFDHVIRGIPRLLNDGGLFIFDALMPQGFLNVWRETFTIVEARRAVIVESEYDERLALGRCHVTGFLKQGRLYRRFDEEHLERAYTAAQIARLLTAANFSFIVHDAYTLARPRQTSERLLYVCRRPPRAIDSGVKRNRGGR